MKPTWLKQVFRNAEGEGAGGASASTGEGASTAPDNDKISALEGRLARMAQSMEGMTKAEQDRELRSRVAAHEGTLTKAFSDAEAVVSASEKALADAFDNGEGAEIAKAQRALTEAVAKRERASIAVDDFRAKVKAAERREGGASGAPGQTQQQLDDTNLKSWKTKNGSWYGIDSEMTKASHEIDRQIRDAGVLSVGSEEYFKAIDRQMSQKFPDRFGGTPQTGGAGGGAAPSGGARKGRISQSIADGWRRMGINVNDPKVLERMVKNRQTAVEKGILPETPVTGGIITR